MARQDKDHPRLFEGFDRPESNWFRMPNSWTDITAGINSVAELKVVEYILRHTWGYQEYEIKKHITIDEFVNGRRRQDGSRMDDGTGLSERGVYDGIRKAVEDGLIEEEADTSDRGRVKKYFSVRMRESASRASGIVQQQDLQPGVQSLQGVQNLQGREQTSQDRGANSSPRSEKDNPERQRKERIDLSNIRKANTNVDKSSENEMNLGDAIAQREGRRAEGGNSGRLEAIGVTIKRTAVARAIQEHEAQGWAARGKKTEPRMERDSGESGRAGGSTPSAPGRGRPRRVVHQDEVYQVIQAYIADFRRELNDRAPLRSSTTRAYNLYKRSGLDQDAFIAQLYAARAIVKERATTIRTQGEDNAAGFPVKHRAGYYFAVLEDLLGLREPSPAGSMPGSEPKAGTR